MIDGESVSEIRARLAGSLGTNRFDTAELIPSMQGLVNDPTLNAIGTTSDSEGFTSIENLRQSGLIADFRQDLLELHLSVPPHLKPDSEIKLVAIDETYGNRGATVSPADFSAYVNLRSTAGYTENSSSGSRDGIDPLEFRADGAINLHGVVLESEISYHEADDTHWRRGETRLVYDIPDRVLRFTAGDLRYGVSGLQSYVPMLGVSVERDFRLQPYRITEPLGGTSIYLREASEVEVFVNGRRVRRLKLPSGTHNLSNFRFANGANDVELRITDSVGNVERVRLSYFFDSNLLAEGEHEFGYNFGFPEDPSTVRREYIFDSPALTLFHRRGFNDRLTLGGNIQADRHVQMAGIEGLWATELGIFQPDANVSHMRDGDLGYAAGLEYRYFDASPSNTTSSSFSAGAHYASRRFATLGNEDPENEGSWSFSARYSQRLFYEIQGGIGGVYQINRTDGDTSGINVFLSRYWRNGVAATIDFDHRRLRDGSTDTGAFLTLRWTFGSANHSLAATHDTTSDISTLDYQYFSPRVAGGFDASAGVEQSPDAIGANGLVHYRGYRGEATLRHSYSDRNDIDRTSNRTALSVGTALVYADGEVAVSRPVTDSFLIAKKHENLDGQLVGLDEIDGVYSAKADMFGSGVIPNLASYQVRTVSINAPELPFGYELGPDHQGVKPRYRSGTVLRIGTDATVMLMGELVDAGGAPVALESGEIKAIGETDVEGVAFFTNRTGRFVAEGLKPGLYTIRLLTTNGTAEVDISGDASGILRVDTITISDETSEHLTR